MRIAPSWQPPAVDVEDERVCRLCQELGLSSIIAQILVSRGIHSPEDASKFLKPTLDHLHDPYLLTDLKVGVDRLFSAIARGERIAVHGDYDVDGVASTVMLKRLIELLGGDVIHYIPERLTDGYGLQPDGIDRLNGLGVQVVVSVDCGIRSQTAAARAKLLGIDLVITDHHEPGETLPDALAVINPRRQDCRYPDKNLAGVGVAFKLVQGICRKADRPDWIPGFLKMAAFGTVADVVPLKGENRVITSLGLDRLSRGPNNVGLRTLIEESGLSGKRIGSSEVAFQLAPRVNAAGRMSTPDLAARLLLSNNESEIREIRRLAKALNDENLRRKEEEARILDEAKRRISSQPEIGAQNAVVIWGDGWHRGVIGIVASKLVEQFCRPVIVLSVDGDIAYGSGRSIPGYHLLSALDRCGDLFVRYGGHQQAAGVTIETTRLPELRKRIADHANQALGPEDLVPSLKIDASISLSNINETFMRDLVALEPFGPGNKRPIFVASPVEVVDGPHVMKNLHLRMTVEQKRKRFRAVAWRDAGREEFYRSHINGLKMAFSLVENSFRGKTSVELNVSDVK